MAQGMRADLFMQTCGLDRLSDGLIDQAWVNVMPAYNSGRHLQVILREIPGDQIRYCSRSFRMTAVNQCYPIKPPITTG